MKELVSDRDATTECFLCRSTLSRSNRRVLAEGGKIPEKSPRVVGGKNQGSCSHSRQFGKQNLPYRGCHYDRLTHKSHTITLLGRAASESGKDCGWSRCRTISTNSTYPYLDDLTLSFEMTSRQNTDSTGKVRTATELRKRNSSGHFDGLALRKQEKHFQTQPRSPAENSGDDL